MSSEEDAASRLSRLTVSASGSAATGGAGAASAATTSGGAGSSADATSSGDAGSRAAASALPSSKAYHNPRKLSVLSNMVPPCLKGICYTMQLSGGSACVGRLSNVKVNALAALREIAAEGRRAGLAEGEEPGLDICLAGWRTYVWNAFACLIQIEVSDNAYRLLYHESKICGVTRRCWKEDCAEIQ